MYALSLSSIREKWQRTKSHVEGASREYWRLAFFGALSMDEVTFCCLAVSGYVHAWYVYPS